MNENLKKLLTGVGITEDIISEVVKDDNPEDFSVEPYVQTFKDTQTKLFENQYRDRLIDKNELDQKFNILRETHASKISKEFNLGYSRNELKNMELEEVLAKATEKMNETVLNASSKSDKELLAQVKSLQEANALSKEEIEGVKERYELEIGKVKNEYDSKLNSIQVSHIFQKEFEKYKWGLEPALIPVIKKQIQEEILENYSVSADGSMSGKSGEHATDFDGTGLFENVSQPIEILLKKYKAIAKVQVPDEDKNFRTPTGGFNTKNMSPAAQAILAAAKRK